VSGTACLRTAGGDRLPLPGHRWLGEADALERALLASLTGPVLDIGCGPGRHVVALAELGLPALGIDVTPAALRSARRRGATVLQRSVFGRVPGAGRWPSALLLDGNVGIGGDPVTLVRRVGLLLRPGGRLLVETGPPGSGGDVRIVTLEIDGRSGPWFEWASVGADEAVGLARDAGMATATVEERSGRWFAWLECR